MAVVVCCPCGNPLDCDNLEIVVTLTCPRCRRELLLEMESPRGGCVRAILTVMEGPCWVGEQFVVPVDVDLTIGTGTGNWLSLESERLGDVHCHLRLDSQGRLFVEDHQSAEGTWIAEQRVLRGRLLPQQSLKVGEFRFRLDYQTPDGTGTAAAAAVPAQENSRPLPAMERVSRFETPGRWLVHNRFPVARMFILTFAWLTAVHHGCRLPLLEGQGWTRWSAFMVAVGILVGLWAAAQRVTLIHRYYKFASFGALVLLAVLSLTWGLPVAGAAALALASCLTLLIIRTPEQPAAILAAVLGVGADTLMTVLAAQAVRGVVFAVWGY